MGARTLLRRWQQLKQLTQADRAPYGTFVELRIVDQKRLRTSLPDHPDGQTIKRKLARWQLFDTLDRTYLGFCQLCPQRFVDDPVVQQALVKALLAIERRPVTLDLPYQLIWSGIQTAHSQAEVLEALRQFQARFTVDAV